MVDLELGKSVVLDSALEDRFAQFAVDFEGHRAVSAAVVASGLVQADH